MPLLIFFIPVGLALLYAWRQRAAEGGDYVSTLYPSIDTPAPAFNFVPDFFFPDAVAPAPVLVSSDPPVVAPDIESAIMTSIKSLWAPPARAAAYTEKIGTTEATYGLPRNLLARVIQQESNFNPAARSPVGALGIAQFMPATARDLGVDPLQPFAAIDAAGKYLRSLFDQTGDWSRALAAYNWGIGNVQRYGIARAPLETRNYVSAITRDVQV
jgi:soluble lytic murein transglycosylase-like protein